MRQNPETVFFKEHTEHESLLSKPEEELLVGKLKKKFVDPFKNDAPDPENFVGDPYTDKEVETDLAETQRRETSIHKEMHDRARLAEALLYYLIEHEELFGPKISAIPASRYDDLLNGVDMILEIQGGVGPHWLAVDVTSSEDKRDIDDKKIAIIKALRNEKITEVKYFQSEPDIKGRINMPKIVLNITHAELKDIAAMLYNGITDDAVIRRLQERLTNQLKSQLSEAEHVLNVLQRPTNKRHELMGVYKKLRQSISPIS